MKSFIIVTLVIVSLYAAMNNAVDVRDKLSAKQAYALSFE